MKNNILLKTNLLVSVILLVGFALIATLSYRANYNASLVKIKQVSSLASEGIYYRLSTMLTKPVNISQTIAHDSLLIKLLEEEGSRYQEAGYQETISTGERFWDKNILGILGKPFELAHLLELVNGVFR